MNKKNTGGAAFPSGLREVADDTVESLHLGMTLRDYFAAKAMAVVDMSNYTSLSRESRIEYIARMAYAHADTMLKARAA